MVERLKHVSLGHLYVIIAISLGLLMLFINPPFQVPDEGAHYIKSLAVAEGGFRCGGDVFAPNNYINLASDVQLVKIKDEKYKKVSGSQMRKSLTTSASSDESIVPNSVCNVSPLSYIPQALGIKLGLLTNAPPLISFYLARLLTFTVAIFLVYQAIKMAPFGKVVFLIVGLLPMSVQQISSLSYDSLQIGTVLFFIAYALRQSLSQQKLSKKDQWIFLGLSIIATNIKPGYFLLSGLVFLFSKEAFANNKKYWLYTIGVVAANMIAFLLLHLIFNEAGVFSEDVNPNEQLIGVLKNPFWFVVLVIESLYKNWRFYYETFLLKPGWMETGLHPLLYIFIGGGIIVLIRSYAEKVSLSVKQRFVLFAVFIAQFLFVFLSLYLIWTPVGSENIKGVQGRYLLAIFPLLIFSFYKSKFDFRSRWIRENMTTATLIFMAVVFFFVFFDIIGLYYKDVAAYLNK
jgi:uncharacterized membrane protein